MGRGWSAVVGLVVAALLATGIAWAAAPGDLDRSFGGDGLVRTDMGGRDSVHAVAVGSHHRIVAVGTSSRYSRHVPRSLFALARYTPRGKLDRDFSGDGKAYAKFGAFNDARGAVMDRRDRIVVAGTVCDRVDKRPAGCKFVVVRFLPNGELDRSFGTRGGTTTAFPGEAGARAVALTAHGRIVVAGESDGEVALARYKRNGKLDADFGAGGTMTTDVGAGDESGTSLAIDARRRAFVGSGGGELVVTRFRWGGRVSRGFGKDGTATAHFGGYDSANSVAVDSRDRIVAAGYTQFETGRAAFAVARFEPSGKLDDSFSHNGKVKTRFTKFVDYANAVGIDSRGRIVAAGADSGLRNPAIARYTTDGRLDHSFSKDGKARTKFGPRADAMAIDQRDRIVVAGWPGIEDFGLARFVGYRRP